MRLVRFMLIMMIGDDAYHCVIISNLVDDDSVDNWCAGFSVQLIIGALDLVLACMRAPLLLIMVVVSAGIVRLCGSWWCEHC